MKILGISEGHNCTAALMIDGQIMACASEERFSRLKNDVGYPQKAIDFCLNYAGITALDLDLVAFSNTELEMFWDGGVRNESLLSVDDHIYEQHEYYEKLLIQGEPIEEIMPQYMEKLVQRKGLKSYYDFSKISFKDLLDPQIHFAIRKKALLNHLNIAEEKIKFIDHHECHAYYAYFSNRHRSDNTLIMTMDSSGDRGVNATLNLARDGKIEKIFETNNFQWARIYKYITLLLGMKPHEHEYKVMGLAPYGNIKEINKSYPIFNEIQKVNGLEFEWVKTPKDLYFYFRELLEGHRFDGIAGALQKKLEELVSEWLSNALKMTGVKNVVFGGGLAMNIKLNLTLSKLPNVETFYVPPSPADESNAIGACYRAYYDYYKESGQSSLNILPLADAYLGPEFDSKGLLRLIEQNYKNKYEIIPDMNDYKIAKMIVDGKIIARCIGRMEFGARALGNRSILADPSKLSSVKKINNTIKHRDFWMPFTPSILEDAADRYLVNEKKFTADYMTLGFETKEAAHSHLCAALHSEDLTARPQIVRKDQNPLYYNLIKEFYNLTGIGGILNTSLNLHGHPIVNTAEDLLFVLDNSDLEYVYIDSHLVRKK